jgi:ABC-type polysaccharide/polyol phosphate transport system ATPase subunit/SAM-dependent methyltransferase
VQMMIEAQQLSKRFLLRHNRSGELKVRALALLDRRRRETVEEFWALRDVSLRIERSEAVGLIGRNGSGKSTFLKLIAAIHRPTTGRLLVAAGARIGTMIELGVGFHPELTGRENVFLNAAIHGLSRPGIDAIYAPVVAYSGLDHFMDVPIKNYSSGMYLRLGFAIAANLDPDILLLDEIFAVGDADFQQRCMDTLQRFQANGCTILFVSHSPTAIQAVCRRVCVLDGGELVFDGGVAGGLAHYQRLLEAMARQPASGEPAAADGQVRPVSSSAHPPVDLDTTEADLELAAHRQVTGGRWAETGDWVFEFLCRQGLQPHHYVLEVGCGSLAAARHFLQYLDQSHYWGFERNRALFEAGVRIELPRAGVRPERGHFVINDVFDFREMPHAFDYAIAGSLFARLSLNSVARCIAGVMRKLEPGGRFYATWYEQPDPARFEPIQRDGLTTYPDAEPYHHPFGLIETICSTLGVRLVREEHCVPHPRGETVLVMTRAGEAS